MPAGLDHVSRKPSTKQPEPQRPLLAGCSTSDGDDHGLSEYMTGIFVLHDGILYPAAEANAHMREHGKLYGGTSFCMAPNHPVREWAIRASRNKCVTNSILAVILLNCMTMLLRSTGSESQVSQIEVASMYIFTLELLVKITAHGLVFHEGAYLHSPWHLLVMASTLTAHMQCFSNSNVQITCCVAHVSLCEQDVVVVAPFWITFLFPQMPSFASLQLARALRPLRTLQAFPELRRVVNAFLKAGPALSSVVALTGFFFLVLGIIGIEMYAGVLHHRCDISANGPDLEPQSSQLAGRQAARTGRLLEWPDAKAEQTVYCASNSSVCAERTCFDFKDNPVSGGSFDDFSAACIVILKAVSFDGWIFPMYELASALPELATFTYIYFNLMAIMGGFFLFNLFVAVIFDEVMRSVDFAQALEEAEAAASKFETTSVLDIAKNADAVAVQETQQLTTSCSAEGAAAEDGAVGLPRPYLSDGSGQSPRRASLQGSPDPLRSSDCCGFDAPLQFIGYVTACAIAINVILMCAPYRGMSKEYERTLEQLGHAFTIYFSCEAVLKIGLYGNGNPVRGWQNYWMWREDARWNRLDFMVLAIELVSNILETYLFSLGGSSANATAIRVLRVFRAVRVLRAFKLSHVWEPLHQMLQTMFKAATTVSSLGVLILIFMLMFAIFGKELFGGKGLHESTRMHFDEPVSALLTVMIIFSGEWADFLTDVGRAVPGSTPIIFVVVTLLVGYFVIVNLFVAVLVEAFVHDEIDRRRKRSLANASFKSHTDGSFSLSRAKALPISYANSAGADSSSGPLPSQLSMTSGDDNGAVVQGSACVCCSESSRIRRGTRKLLQHQSWKAFILATILSSCICLAYDNPELDPRSELAQRLVYANLVISAVFTLEAALKITVHGFVCGPGAYLRQGWNQLDFFILLTSYLVFVGADSNVSVVRLLRVLRPLRLVHRVPGMAAIFTFFAQAYGDIINVTGVIIFFQLIFAVMGMQLFLYADFERSELSFDNFPHAMTLLFVTATGDDWPSFMWSAMDMPTHPGDPPVRNDQSAASMYFIAWLYIGQWMCINLFVATVVNNFVRIKDQESSCSDTDMAPLMTREQRQWQAAMQAARDRQRSQIDRVPQPPDSSIGAWVHQVVTSKQFEVAMSIVIMFNVLVMSFKYYRIEQDAFYRTYKDLMFMCTRMYYAECILKMIGLTVDGYFSSGWNRFEFLLVIAAILDEFASEIVDAYLPLPPMLLRVLRIARILRILRLLKSVTGLRNVIMTLFLSIPSFLNIGALLSLVIFMYAVLGVQLFFNITPGEFLHGASSFTSVSRACQVLMQCLTTDGWAALMLDALNPPQLGRCDPSATPTDCGTPVAFIYFISFMIIVLFILTNLVVAIILQNFSSLGDLNPGVASKADIEAFDERWNEHDTDCDGFILAEHFPLLLMSLDRPLRPLGVPEGDSAMHRIKTRRMIASLVASGHMPERVHHGYLDYSFVLTTLIRYSFEHYNRFHSVKIDLPPVHESHWAVLRRRGVADIINAARPEKRSVGALLKALTAQGILGSGTTTEQLRSLTQLVKAQAVTIECLESRLNAVEAHVNFPASQECASATMAQEADVSVTQTESSCSHQPSESDQTADVESAGEHTNNKLEARVVEMLERLDDVEIILAASPWASPEKQMQVKRSISHSPQSAEDDEVPQTPLADPFSSKGVDLPQPQLDAGTIPLVQPANSSTEFVSHMDASRCNQTAICESGAGASCEIIGHSSPTGAGYASRPLEASCGQATTQRLANNAPLRCDWPSEYPPSP